MNLSIRAHLAMAQSALTESKYWAKIRLRVLYLLRKSARPVRLGEVAIDNRLNLRETRVLLNEMIDEGIVRESTPDECKKHQSLHHGYAFVLTDPTSIPFGDLETWGSK